MLIIADTLLLADISLRDKNNHQENYYTEEKKKILSLPEQLIQSEFLFERNKQIYTEGTLILGLHNHMQKHLIRITETEINVLLRTNSHILIFTVNSITEAAASNHS